MSVNINSIITQIVRSPTVGVEVYLSDADAGDAFNQLVAGLATISNAKGYFLFKTDGNSLHLLLTYWGNGVPVTYTATGFSDTFTLTWQPQTAQLRVDFNVVSGTRKLVWSFTSSIAGPNNTVTLPNAVQAQGTIDGGNFADLYVVNSTASPVDGGDFSGLAANQTVDGGIF